MILFAKDWARFPTAIVDTSTRNHSFVRLASVYRSMGVKNHAFPLALMDPHLKGVDPHSPTLTQDQMLRIALECKRNPWYFFREIARAPAIGGTDATPVEGNRSNVALWWMFFNHITQILIQPRQTGKSFSTDTLMTLLMHVICTNTKINLLTKDDTLRRANVARLKEIASDLPVYLNQKGPDDLNNTEEITINILGNRYTTHVPQSSPKAADKLGRGLTTSIMHVDEAPFQTNIKISLEAALPAMGAAADKSAAEGAPYGTIYTTTAGKKDDRDGRYVYEMLQNSAIWSEVFFDAVDEHDLERMIRRNSRGGVRRVAAVFNHRQLGKSDDWLAKKLEESNISGDAANRDYFNMWTAGSQTNPLPISVLEQIRGSLMDVKFTEISPINGYVTRWYIPQDEILWRMNNSQFVMALDTSEASGNDDISLVLLDIKTLDVVACGTYNETNLIKFSEWLASWFARFINFTGIIERRSTGAVVLDYLLLHLPQMGIDPFKRLFNTVVHEYREEPSRYEELSVPLSRRDPNIYVRLKKAFGYATSGSGYMSRSALYSTALQLAAKRAAHKVHDKPLIDQITGLIVKNGRIDHEDGEHDDMVIAWLLCHWLITQGVNLAHYGIDIRVVAKEAVEELQVDPQTLQFRREQQDIRDRITALGERLKKEQDDFISMRLEQELRLLTKRIVLDDNEVFSVDELLTQIRENKRHQRRGGGINPDQRRFYEQRALQQSHGSFYNANGPFYGR